MDEVAVSSGQGFKVTGISPDQAPVGANGAYVKGMSVAFTTNAGHASSVFLTQSQYDSPNAVETIREMVAQAADKLYQVTAISG